MNCCNFVELLVDFSDGLLAGETLAKFEEHRESCQHCSGYASKYLETIRLGRSACHRACDDTPTPDDQVADQLVRRILGASEGGESIA